MTLQDDRAKDMQPFVIVGQARSGTTLLQTLLSSHPNAVCRGELFDTWQIDDNGSKTRSLEALFQRDSEPESFLVRMLSGEGLKPPLPRAIGFKLLTQHNPAVLLSIVPKHPGWRILYVRRDNKLAQFASRQQVQLTGRWVSITDTPPSPKLKPNPRWAMEECNRLELHDELLHRYLSSLPNEILTVSYSELSQTRLHVKVLEFLGLDPDVHLNSAMKKQGHNDVNARFENAEEMRTYFRGCAKDHWLGLEM